jgi:glutaredoxin 3
MIIEIYTKSTCPYCHRAKELLLKKSIKFQEYDLIQSPELRDLMIERAGGLNTVPQIFINNKYLSDCEGLFILENTGKLDKIIEENK